MIDDRQNDLNALEEVAVALRARNTKQAVDLADAIMARGLRHPILYVARASRFSQAGQFTEALTELRRAEASSPPNQAILSEIGHCLIRLDRIQEGIKAYQAAVAIQPNAAPLHYQEGWAHEMADDLASAAQAHERAIQLQPDHANALGHLAFLATRRGDWTLARAYARRALAHDDQQPAARLALAAADIEHLDYDAAEQNLRALLAQDKAGQIDRYIALSLLGDVADARDRVDDAVSLYIRANEIRRKAQGGRAGAARKTMLSAVEDLLHYMETARPVSASAPSKEPLAPERPHIFLLGFPRSGTTLLEQILASRSDVAAIAEKDTLADSVRAFMTHPSDLGRLNGANRSTLESYRAAYWQRVRAFGPDPHGMAFVDKTPINTVKLPVIARVFPRAKILFAVRDPRDVVLSCFRRRLGANATTLEFLTLESTARFYDSVMKLSEVYRSKLALNLLQIRHEDLVSDFDGQMSEICDFIELPWDDAMRDFASKSRQRAIATPSAVQIGRGLNRRGIGQWRRYAKHLEAVLPILDPWVQRFGYPIN